MNATLFEHPRTGKATPARFFAAAASLLDLILFYTIGRDEIGFA
jgi:hypothetical protein